MSGTRTWNGRICAALLASVVATSAALAGGAASASASPTDGAGALKGNRADRLGSHDRELLTKAEARHEATVTLMVATDAGKAKDVAAKLKALGASVGKRIDKIGYVRAQVPTSAVSKAAALGGVTAVDLNETIPLPKPDLGIKSDNARLVPGPVPGPMTPAANPYMPTNETGAVAFKQAHPTWDGRGATIGIMDTGVDLDHPALQTTSTGERKIVDWFTATDPLLEGDGTWRAMITDVTGPSFSYGGFTWTAPAGAYKINQFSESATAGGEEAGDVNRDGDTSDKFGILYDATSHDIRVDVNQNHDFTDDAVMAQYKKKFDVGHFGTDNPATAVREQLPFVVEYREDVDTTPAGRPGVADFVNIGIVEGLHGTHVAGITAANDMFGNPDFDGAAPGAKIVSARACSWSGGCGGVALVEGMAELVMNRHVDVVNMSIGGLPALNYADPADADVLLYDRLIDDYGVQLIISAGNSGPAVNTVGSPSLVTNVVSVAASISKETWLSNYGSVVRKPLNLFPFSSRGPAEDGAFKPNIAAPGSAVSTAPLWQPGSSVPEAGYPLQPGYQMQNGTSMAAPQTTGGAALLLSAAKATGKGVTPAALRRAMYSSATWIDGVSAAGQGNGQLNIPGSWELLDAGVQTRTYAVDAPVCTPLSGGLHTPDRGRGIYNRCAASEGGLKPNKPKLATITLTRTSGAKGRIAHDLRWIGNDGTFSSIKQTIQLPLNKPVQIPVRIKAGVGAHSAILRVDDPSTQAVDFEIMNTVVVSNDTKAPAYSATTAGSVDRNSTTSFFVTVPAGARALQVDLSGIATGSQIRFVAFSPAGLAVDSTASRDCYMNFSDPAICKPQERSYENPMPGIWELEVESRRTSPALENPFNLTARIQGVTVTPPVVELPSVAAGQPSPVSFTVTNDFGPVTVAGQGGPLGSKFSSRPTIAQDEDQTYQVVVPAGATRLEVSIGNPSDTGSDLDLYVRLDGKVVGQSADGDSEETVSLKDPAPGTYEVQVAGYAVPSGSTAYDYRDVFYSPALGAVAAPGATVTLANGASTTITGSVTATAPAAAGRQLFGELRLVTDEEAVVGRGSIVIGAVG